MHATEHAILVAHHATGPTFSAHQFRVALEEMGYRIVSQVDIDLLTRERDRYRDEALSLHRQIEERHGPGLLADCVSCGDPVVYAASTRLLTGQQSIHIRMRRPALTGQKETSPC